MQIFAKVFYYTASALLLCLIAFHPNNQKTFSHKKLNEEKRSLLPSEQRFYMFNYPDFNGDPSVYKNAMAEAEINRINSRFSTTNALNIPWQVEGPGNIGGRITCIATQPGNTNVILIGTPNGGVFKSNNGGTNWTPIFDTQNNLSIGSIAFDPQNNQTIYVGTGDPAVSGYPFIGDGIYKSTDGGTTWANSGLNNVGVICKVAVHPTNANIILVAAMGLPMQRDNNRGIYKSTDGGASWTQVKFIDNETGFSDVIIDPINPQNMYATSWRRIRNNQESVVSGHTSRVYKSIDGGNTWNILNGGLPQINATRYGICMSQQNANTLYVSVVDSTLNIHGIYKTTNGGSTWSAINITGLDPSALGGFGWYFGRIEVNPSDDNQLFVCGVDLWYTPDGGTTWDYAAPQWWSYDVHADKHDILFLNNSSFLLATDGGLYKTTDLGQSYTDIENLPITQFYRVAHNPHSAGEYFGGAQDNGTTGGNTTNMNAWPRIYGGDGFQPLYDPLDANNVWAETQNGGIVCSNDGGVNFNSGDINIDFTDRRNWDMPIVMNSANPNIMFTGTHKVYMNQTGVNPYWDSISGDLTDGNIFGARFHNISAIENSSLNASYIYAGTSDGNVWRSLNNGGNWTNITASLPDRYVSHVCASPNVVNNVYVTHTGYKSNDFSPHIHKSINNGASWVSISGDLPNFALYDVWVYPGNENLIFVASDAGVYYTQNGGINWFRAGNNMPLFPVYDIDYNPINQKLFAGTFARSIWSIDISSLATGIRPLSVQNSIEIFPNPAMNYIQFSTSPEEIGQSAEIFIYDTKGSLVLQSKQTLQWNNILTIEGLAKGNYSIQLQFTNGKKKFARFVKI
jgi:photosystem II stability/assembly factor-like uncharacterized protein